MQKYIKKSIIITCIKLAHIGCYSAMPITHSYAIVESKQVSDVYITAKHCVVSDEYFFELFEMKSTSTLLPDGFFFKNTYTIQYCIANLCYINKLL